MQDTNFQKVMKDLKQMSSTSGDLSGLSTLKSKGTELKKGANNLNEGINTLSSQTTKLNELQTGIQALNTGMLELKQGLSTAKVGSNSLENGLSTLNNSSKQVKDGINQINNGSNQAFEGSNTLLAGTQTFNDEIENGITDTNKQLEKLDGIDTYVKEPIKIEQVEYGKVTSYGLRICTIFHVNFILMGWGINCISYVV